MKRNKGLLAILVVCCFLMCTAATCNQFLCKPTVSQQNAASMGLTVAQTLLSAGAAVIGGPIAAALASNAVPTYQRVVDGWCVTQAEWDAATKSVEDGAKAAPKVVKSLGTFTLQGKAVNSMELVLQALKQVKWNR